jgi:hypothetical protein
MHMFAHVIAEQQDGHWNAWFNGVPQRATDGPLPVVAILRLLALCSEGEFDPEGVVALPDATREGHLAGKLPRLILFGLSYRREDKTSFELFLGPFSTWKQPDWHLANIV